MGDINRFREVSETEMEILEFLWSKAKPISTTDLLTYFNDERQKNWKTQTIATFLSRLAKKGLVKTEMKGRGTLHYPAVTFEEYNKLKAKNVLEVMYGGSIKNFFVALYGDKKLSKDDIADLKKWLSER